ncbi:MAG: 50S ribosomal protein L23 [Desulfovibrionaceae bacterium]|nr:50S ribosomal protein L23 [Desulfovibrionaceae bacterium]
MDYTQILIKPIISEKATLLRDGENKIAFYVNKQANKIEIGKAVEKAFNVKVLDVNVVNRKVEPRQRHGRVIGKVSGYKKAYVTLAEGDKIDFFEGV